MNRCLTFNCWGSQEEICLVQAAFNVKFKDMHEVKHNVIDKIEERLGRVSEIQVSAVRRLISSLEQVKFASTVSNKFKCLYHEQLETLCCLN
jgi:hypothetical protein